jgi:hypothetical protein
VRSSALYLNHLSGPGVSAIISSRRHARFVDLYDEPPVTHGKVDMEPEKFPLNEIKIDRLAQELVRSEQSRPYMDYWMGRAAMMLPGSKPHLRFYGTCHWKSDTRGACFPP